MRPESSDDARLWDIREACAAVRRFLRDSNPDSFVEDDLTRSAVERKIEVIGEQLSRGFKDAHPEVPWKDIVHERNVVAHNYDDLNYSAPWKVATVDVPLLLSQLSLPPTAEPPEGTEG